jgi:hypothetical protein
MPFKGINKVYQQELLVINVDVGVMIEGTGSMSYALSGSFDPDPKLERREIVGSFTVVHSYTQFYTSQGIP